MKKLQKAAAGNAATRSTRLSARTAVVADSQDEGFESTSTCVDSSTLPSPNLATSATFKGVFITPNDIPARRQRHSITTPSSISSASPFTRDNSDELETPLTANTTPAESVNDFQSTRNRKRKSRNIQDISMEDTNTNDEQLARALQEEEYEETIFTSKQSMRGGAVNKRLISLVSSENEAAALDESSEEDIPLSRRINRAKPRPTKTKRKVPLVVNNQDDEKDEISDSEDIPLSKKRKAGSDFSLPKRKARTAAHKALQIELKKQIDDSEDDSALSDFIDDEDEDPLATPSDAQQFFQSDSEEESSDSDGDDIIPAPTTVRSPRTGRVIRSRRGIRGFRRSLLSRAERERQKLEKSHPEIKTMWTDLKAIPKIAVEEAEQPKSISRKLKGFQLEGLNWMIKQEQTQWKGGLLGDEMGMGKTIQAVSLIMSDYPAKQPTLVVVPPVALMQWTNEINDYTDGKLKVLIYHGTNTKAKKMSVKELKSYDVIMISYSGLESIYRKESKGWTRGDKIIKEDSPIHAIHFHRLILDEAHSIKSRTTGVAKACFALQGTYKWCLSGTPVQNRIGEFFSLLRFLNIEPFANYFCKQCPCSTLHWSVTPDYRCTHCRHRTLDHVSVFNQEILNPIIAGESDESRREGLAKLRLLTDRIMLRRMKRDQTASMELPPKEVIVHNEFFGEIERDFSSSIMTNTTRQFDTYVSRGVMLNNYANIFGLIMQMRQVSDHPDLLLKKHADPNQNVLVCNICDEPAEEAIRSKCKHEFCRVCVKDYLKTCEASGAEPDCPRCHIPLSIDVDQVEIEQDEESVKKSSIINRIKMENWTSSTKIEMLVYDLYKLRSKKKTLKSIVFSQFTSMLQLIEWRLRRAGFNTVMLDGSMTPAQRQKSIEYFMKNTHVEVFLVSLKAGGVALNLTEASRVFIVDPWWNPAAEWQSADRCHRIGQKRSCVITRLCIEDSVESRIVMLQEKKANMINGTVNGDEVAMEKLTPEDMQFLFRGS